MSDKTDHDEQPLTSGEMTPGPGFRVRTTIDRAPASVIDRIQRFATADISDRMNRLFTMHQALRPLTPPLTSMAGPAVTVKVFPGDNLMVHKALDVAQPGDIIVVDTSSSLMTAVIGDMICTKAAHRGIGGFVIDGLVRDLDAILALGTMPVFGRGITPIGPLHRGPGEVNHPVACGGVVVHPGDVIVADPDGIVVVPSAEAERIVADLEADEPRASQYAAAVQRGEFSNAWVDDVLAAGGLVDDDPSDPG